MTFEAIIKELKSKKYHPIYFLTGDEPFFIDQISDFIEENVLSEGERSFNQIVLYGKDTEFKTIVDEARQFPMMSSHRVVILKEAQDMKTIAELGPYIANPSNSTILVICYKYKKLDKRTKFAKELSEKAIIMESAKIPDNKMSAWISSLFKDHNLTADPNAVELMSEYLGNDLSKVNNEFEKLRINIPKNKTITTDDIKEQIGISKEFNVFELQSALGSRNFEKASLIVKYMGENTKNNPLVLILSNLMGYFIKVYTAKCYAKEADPILAKMLGMGNAYYVKDYRVASKNYSTERLKHIFQTLKTADQHSKGVGARHASEATILKDILISCMLPN